MSNQEKTTKAARDAGIMNGPHGWIRWKATGVSLDVRCTCGMLTHVDEDFSNEIQCGACGQIYAVSGHVILVPVHETEMHGGPALTIADEPPSMSRLPVARDLRRTA